MGREEDNDVGRLSSVERALDVLEYLRDRGEPIRLSEISSVLGMPKSNVHRILATYTKRGYVYQNPETLWYSLGIASWILGRSIVGFDALIELLEPFLKALGDRVGETVYLAAMRQGKIVYLITYMQPSVPGWVLQGTTEMPIHSTSAGKALMAAKPEADIDAYLIKGLPKYTDYTITDPDVFRKELELTRQRGYALEIEETQMGLCAIDTLINVFLGENISMGFFLPVSTARGDLSGAVTELLETKAIIQSSLERMRPQNGRR